MSSRSVVIYGASRQGAIVSEIILQANSADVVGFLDDDKEKIGSSICGIPVLGGFDWVTKNPREGLEAFVAIGNNDARILLSRRLREAGCYLTNVVHPSAIIMPSVVLGSGVLICAGAILISGTQLEDDTVINTGVAVDHDSLICTGAYLSPGVRTAGCVTVGNGAFVGLGALLGPNVKVGNGAVVGAGSVVLRDIEPDAMVAGTPARLIRKLEGNRNWQRILAGPNER